MNIFQMLLDKKLKKKSNQELSDLLVKAQEKKDYITIASAYYELADRYMKECKKDKANVYYNRFDNLTSQNDKLYNRFKYRYDEVSARINELDEGNVLMNEIRSWIENKATEIDAFEKIQWNLLTMAKMCTLFGQLSQIPQLHAYGQSYEQLLDGLIDGLYTDYVDDEALETMDNIKEKMDEILFEDISPKCRILLPNGYYFEPLDLDGDNLHMNLMFLISEILDYFNDTSNDDISIDFISNSLHYGFYSRVFDEGMESILACMKEKERIMDDFAFIQSKPDKVTFEERMNKYKALYLPEL